jgi:hypothetical protein
MIKPDVIISWPKSVDYPLFRKFLKQERERFNQINIVFTETHMSPDYSEFVKQSLFQNWCLFIQSPQVTGDSDWRNVAIHAGLQQSIHAEWILFLEQDFFPRDGFWEECERLIEEGCEVVSVFDQTRMHPCFLLIKRETLKTKTTKQFGALPPLYDHFGKIQKDLETNGATVGAIHQRLWYHMNGLSHNWRLVAEGERANYKPDEFRNYLVECLSSFGLDLDPRFLEVANNYLNRTEGNHE